MSKLGRPTKNRSKSDRNQFNFKIDSKAIRGFRLAEARTGKSIREILERIGHRFLVDDLFML